MSKNVYIVLSRTQSFVGKTIRWFLRYKYNHVSISLDRELNQMYSFGRLSINNPLVGGMLRESLYTLSLGFKNEAEVKIYCIPVSEARYEKIRSFIYNTYNDSEGYYYNLVGVFGIIFRRTWRMYKTYLCSEFVTEAFQYAGIHLSHRGSSPVSPRDIGEIKNSLPFYEGNLSEYPYLSVENFSKDTLYESEFAVKRGILEEGCRLLLHLRTVIGRHFNSRKGLEAARLTGK